MVFSRNARMVLLALTLLMVVFALPAPAGAATGSITYHHMSEPNPGWPFIPGAVISSVTNIPLGDWVTLPQFPAGTVAWSYNDGVSAFPTAYLQWDINAGRQIQVTGDMHLVAVQPGRWIQQIPQWGDMSTTYTQFAFELSGPAGTTPETIPFAQYQQPPFNVAGTITHVNYDVGQNVNFNYQVPTDHYFFFPPVSQWWSGGALVPFVVNVNLTRSGDSPAQITNTGEVVQSWINGSPYPNGSIAGRTIFAVPATMGLVRGNGSGLSDAWMTQSYSVYRLGPRATYTVTFLPGDGGSWSPTDYVYPGLNLNDPTPTPPDTQTNAQPGWTFMGWDPPLDASVTGNATYTALWARTEYTVSFDPGVAGLWSQADYTYPNLNYGDATPTGPATLGLPGWTFAGWDPPLNTLVDGNATYTALWTRNEYTVTFLPGDHGTFAETQYISLHYGDPTPAGPDPTGAAGWKFIGWQPTPATTVTGDATYTALWEKIPTDKPIVPETPSTPGTGDLSVASLHTLLVLIGAELVRYATRLRRQQFGLRS